MASINEKLNYIGETKSLIKNGLNDLGAEINDNDTFRSYINKIENLYEEWPKISENGEDITLNNTKAGKMRLSLSGNINQEEGTTPEDSKQIHIVKGHNEFKIANIDNTEFQILELDLPEGMEICRIGNYADTFEKVDGKWYKNEIIKKFLFNGSENWTRWNDNLHEYQLETNVADNRANGAWISALCDKFVNNNVGGSLMNNNEFSAFVSTLSDPQRHIWFRFKKDPIDNVNDFKNFVVNNPLTVYSTLEKVNNIEITDSLLISQLDVFQSIKAYNNTTIITQENEDLPFNITATALLKNS